MSDLCDEFEKMNDFVIRQERESDEREVEELIRESFWKKTAKLSGKMSL